MKGWYKTQRTGSPPAPYVRAAVSLERLGVMGLVEFLVDTGADRTVLHSKDISVLRIDLSKLDVKTLQRLDGVGGGAHYYKEPATLYFMEDGEGAFIQSWSLEILLAMTPMNPKGGPTIPSLLGRDILNNFVVRLDPLNDDLTLK